MASRFRPSQSRRRRCRLRPNRTMSRHSTEQGPELRVGADNVSLTREEAHIRGSSFVRCMVALRDAKRCEAADLMAHIHMSGIMKCTDITTFARRWWRPHRLWPTKYLFAFSTPHFASVVLVGPCACFFIRAVMRLVALIRALPHQHLCLCMSHFSRPRERIASLSERNETGVASDPSDD